jgi:hypothetical protein
MSIFNLPSASTEDVTTAPGTGPTPGTRGIPPTRGVWDSWPWGSAGAAGEPGGRQTAHIVMLLHRMFSS